MSLTLAQQCKYRYRELPSEYGDIFTATRKYVSGFGGELFGMDLERTSPEFESQLLPYIEQYIRSENIHMQGYTDEGLIDRLMCDMQYSVLTKPLFKDSNVEKINAVSYKKIRVTFNDGSMCYIEPFLNAEEELNMIQRIVSKLDKATPMAESYIGNKIRVTAIRDPITTDDSGVAFSIRKSSDKVFTMKEYIDREFINEEAYRFIVTALTYGVSFLIVGKVGTGKTSFINSVFSSVPDNKNIFAVENGSRELNLKDKFAICTLTRPSVSENVMNVDEDALVAKMLRFDTDIGIISEMRSSEAEAAVEASVTGISIISSLHAGGARQAYERVADLYCKKRPGNTESAILKAAKAFPIVVFIHQGDDYRRRVTSITEAVVEGSNITYNELYRFTVTKSERIGEDVLVDGNFEKSSTISDALKSQMRNYGAPFDLLDKIA